VSGDARLDVMMRAAVASGRGTSALAESVPMASHGTNSLQAAV